MNPNNSNNPGNQHNYSFDPSFTSHPDFQYFMQYMRGTPTNSQPNQNFPNTPTPIILQQVNLQNYNETQSYHTSQ